MLAESDVRVGGRYRIVVRSRSEGLLTLSFRATATAAELRSFYVSTLTAAGWKVGEEGDFEGPLGARARLAVSPARGGEVIATVMVRD